jgi:tetratricopeptide (TPR) repeat protein
MGAPWFNLALLLQRQNRLEEAKAAVEKAIRAEDSAPYYVLQARIVRDMGKDFAVKEFLNIAWKRFRQPVEQSDWALGWYITAAEMRDDKEAAVAARHERSNRQPGCVTPRHDTEGLLPLLSESVR